MSNGITNMSGAFYISTTAQNTALTQSEFEALSFTVVPNMGNHGDTGVDQNIVGYSVWGSNTKAKGKGEADAGDPTAEFLDVSSAGMDLLIAAADKDNTNNYAYKLVWSDGSIEFNRGLVTGPKRLKGGNEDFKRLLFQFGMQQTPVTVAAA